MNLKIIGLMITRNEEWIIKDSLNVMLRLIDNLIILDASSDSTRDIIETYRHLGQNSNGSYTNIVVYNQEDYPDLKNYGDFRQFLLERGREYGGTHFVMIDADEMFPPMMDNELLDTLARLLPVGCAYQFNVCDFYGDPFHYVKGGVIGSAIIDCIYHDDGQMSYESLAVHEKRTPTIDYIKVNIFPLLHYGYLNKIKMLRRRAYYRVLEYVNGLAGPASINWRYHIWHLNLKEVPYWWTYNFIDYKSWRQDDGEEFSEQFRQLYKMYGQDLLGKVDMYDNFSTWRIVTDRIVEIIRSRDVKGIMKSIRDFIVLDVIKKW